MKERWYGLDDAQQFLWSLVIGACSSHRLLGGCNGIEPFFVGDRWVRFIAERGR